MMLAAAGTKAVVRLLQPADGAQAHVCDFEGHGDAVLVLASHPVLPYVFSSASRDFSIRLWDAKERTCLVRRCSLRHCAYDVAATHRQFLVDIRDTGNRS